jgi:hypothetical protein
MKRKLQDDIVVGLYTDSKTKESRSIPLFSSAKDYAHSCIRTGMEFSVKAAKSYDEASNRPMQPCYTCVYQQCLYDYWEYWRRIEHLERYDAPDTDDEESYERRHKHQIKKLRDEAMKEWDTQTEHLAKCPEPKDGGFDYAQWCAYHNHPFDEAKARAYDVEGNIEELPEGECYPCIYYKKRADYMNMRYTVGDLTVKKFYKDLDDNDYDEEEEEDRS